MPTRLDSLAAHLSAKQTALLGLCGGLISAVGCLAELPLHAAKLHHPNTAFWLWAATGFALMLLGFAIAMFARSELESGIANDRWPDTEVESLRNLVRAPVAMAIPFALFIAMVGLILISRRNTPIFWACFILIQTFTQLSYATRRPPETPSRWLSTSTARWPDEISSLAPIQSQHWGNR
jgi:hypothetical protein